MSVEIKVLDTEIKADLAQIIDNAKDQTVPMKQSVQVLQAEVFRHFQDEQGSAGGWWEGGAWEPLSPSTIYNRRHRKSKRSFSTKILQDTGALRQSIKSYADKDIAMVSTDTPYAVFHEQPDGPGKGIIPKRDFMWLSRNGEEKVLLLFSLHNLGEQ